MEYDSIIVSFCNQSNKILDRLGCVFWIELDDDISEVGFEFDFWIGHKKSFFYCLNFASLFGEFLDFHIEDFRKKSKLFERERVFRF